MMTNGKYDSIDPVVWFVYLKYLPILLQISAILKWTKVGETNVGNPIKRLRFQTVDFGTFQTCLSTQDFFGQLHSYDQKKTPHCFTLLLPCLSCLLRPKRGQKKTTPRFLHLMEPFGERRDSDFMAYNKSPWNKVDSKLHIHLLKFNIAPTCP